jgi:hypothetical protein
MKVHPVPTRTMVMNNTAPFNLQVANFVQKNKTTTAQSAQCDINILQETMEHFGQNIYLFHVSVFT